MKSESEMERWPASTVGHWEAGRLRFSWMGSSSMPSPLAQSPYRQKQTSCTGQRLVKALVQKIPYDSFQLYTVSNYVINSIKREKSNSFVGVLYRAEQDNGLFFCPRLG